MASMLKTVNIVNVYLMQGRIRVLVAPRHFLNICNAKDF